MKRPRAPRLLLDTHIWVWYVLGSPDLSRPLRDALDESLGSCWLSPVSMWELGLLVSKGRMHLDLEYRAWIKDAFVKFPVREPPFNFEVGQRVYDLSLPHGDPADHLLAATALVYGLTLVTVDRRLTGAKWLPTLTA